jgi:hypothetical protein
MRTYENSFRTFSVCSPNAGMRHSCAADRGSVPAPDTSTGPLGVSTLMRRRCGMRDETRHVVHAPEGDVGGCELRR